MIIMGWHLEQKKLSLSTMHNEIALDSQVKMHKKKINTHTSITKVIVKSINCFILSVMS